MSLQSLRELRLRRLRPAMVSLVTMDCPRPQWLWLRDDPALVWLPQRSDVRAHDLRPLTGLPVEALVDCVERRAVQVRAALEAVGATLVGIADKRVAQATEDHPWANRHPQWREGAQRLLLLRWVSICEVA